MIVLIQNLFSLSEHFFPFSILQTNDKLIALLVQAREDEREKSRFSSRCTFAGVGRGTEVLTNQEWTRSGRCRKEGPLLLDLGC